MPAHPNVRHHEEKAQSKVDQSEHHNLLSGIRPRAKSERVARAKDAFSKADGTMSGRSLMGSSR